MQLKKIMGWCVGQLITDSILGFSMSFDVGQWTLSLIFHNIKMLTDSPTCRELFRTKADYVGFLKKTFASSNEL